MKKSLFCLLIILLPVCLFGVSVDEVVNKLKSEDVSLSGQGMREAVGLGQSAVPQLIKLLNVNNERTSILAMICLGRIGDERAVKPICLLLKNGTSRMRYSAATVLGYFKTEESKQALKETLAADPEEMIKVSAACALGMQGDKSGYAVATEAMESSDESLKVEAITALGYIGDERAVDVLKQAKNVDGTRNAADVALKQIEIGQAMKSVVKTAPGGKVMAMAGAPADNKKIRIKKLSEVLTDQSYAVREWALKTLLLEVKDEEVKQTLIGIAKDKNNAASERVEQELKVLGIKTDEK